MRKIQTTIIACYQYNTCQLSYHRKYQTESMESTAGNDNRRNRPTSWKTRFPTFDGSLEQWEYQSGGIATSCKFLIIEFRNGKVTSMDPTMK